MSRADSSNPTSDYDFGDIQQEDIDEELNMMKSDIQKLDMNLMLVLNRFPLSDTIIGNFGAFQINYPQLKSLHRNDLIKLGILDNKLQDEMLEEFKLLEGQESTLKEVLDIKETEKDNNATSIVESLQDHIFRLNTLLTAVTFQVGTSSSSSSGVVINQRFCSAQVVMHLLHQLANHTAEMDEIVKTLSDAEKLHESESEYLEKKRKDRKRNIVLISTIGFFIAGIYLAKRIGLRKAF